MTLYKDATVENKMPLIIANSMITKTASYVEYDHHKLPMLNPFVLLYFAHCTE